MPSKPSKVPGKELALEDIKETTTRRKLANIFASYREHSATIAAAKEQQSILMDSARPLLDKLKLRRLSGDDFTAIKTAGRKTLSKGRLLDRGVDIADIEYATVEGEPYWQVRGVEVGDSSGEDNE